MRSLISSIGCAVPEFEIYQDKIVSILSSYQNFSEKEQKFLEKMYKSTGIERRHSVLPDYTENQSKQFFLPKKELNQAFPTTADRMVLYKDNALELAMKAIHKCLGKKKDLNIDDITHVITVSCTGMYAPGLDIEIVNTLGLQSTTSRTAINYMGCYGAFNGMKVASAFCKSNPKAKVLLVSVELCSLHYQQKLTKSNIIANTIFSDGASAVLIEGQTTSNSYLILNDFHCDIIPQTNDQMAWSIGDSGFEMVLSSYIPGLIKSGIENFTNKLFKKNGLLTSEIDHFAIHPGGIKILKGCEEALSIPKNKIECSYSTLNQYGNMSSATILFVIDELFSSITTKAEKNIFCCAFGPGLTMESALLTAVYK